MNPNAGKDVIAKDYTLEKLEFGVSEVIPDEMLRSSKFTVEQIGNYFGESLLFKLNRYVLADHVHTDTQKVFFEVPAIIDIPIRERYWKWYFIPWKRTRQYSGRHTVCGYVNVDCKQYQMFPEATIAYPKELGKPYRYTALQARPVH